MPLNYLSKRNKPSLTQRVNYLILQQIQLKAGDCLNFSQLSATFVGAGLEVLEFQVLSMAYRLHLLL